MVLRARSMRRSRRAFLQLVLTLAVLAILSSTRVLKNRSSQQAASDASDSSGGGSGGGAATVQLATVQMTASQPARELDERNFALWVQATTVAPGNGSASGADASSSDATKEACLPAPELEWLQRNFEAWAKAHTHLDKAVVRERQAMLRAVAACTGGPSSVAVAGGGGPAMRSPQLARLAVQLLSNPAWTEAASKCPPGCTAHGTCNEELGRCDCPLGYSGPACEQHAGPLGSKNCTQWAWPANQACDAWGSTAAQCLNACNSRGDCYGAFCHCYPGYFGQDCALSVRPDGAAAILDGQGYKENPAGPAIYVYDLPPHVSTWFPWFIDRFEALLLAERILSGGHRTADPSKADWFWGPTTLRLLWTYDQFAGLYHALSQSWPMWNATGGARHVLMDNGDWPICERSEWFKSHYANVTFLVHWGSVKKRDIRYATGCFRTEQDIVFPPENVASGTSELEEGVPWFPGNKPQERNITFIFAGGICSWHEVQGPPPCKDKDYSFGVRERVWNAHRNRTGYIIASQLKGYHMLSGRSQFCLAPAGAGWGRRATSAPWFGCIPVVIQDHILQAFEPFLDWSRFSLRLPEAEIESMHEVLAGIAGGPRLKEFQDSLLCAAKHMFWAGTYGRIFGDDSGEYDAFNTLMAILRAKRRHPGVPADQLRETDSQLKQFMECRLPKVAGSGGEPLCLYSAKPSTAAQGGEEPCIPASAPLVQVAGFKIRRMQPGGAVCHGAPNIAQCHRFTGGSV
ncbi:hypothetical protein ABPG75_001758 [Micractinium tetrahymenae]